MSEKINQETFPNGFTLLAEEMDDVRSASFNLLIPAGCAYDPPQHSGIASVLNELITRGAGERDHEQLMLDLDNLGLDRSESVSTYHIQFWGATLARNLPAALEIYADIVRKPHLPEDDLEPVQALALQDLMSLEDRPEHLLGIQLRKLYLPPPLSNERRGTPEGIQSLTLDAIRSHQQRLFQPKGAILSVAGNLEWKPLRDQVARIFADWSPTSVPELALGEIDEKHHYREKETTQTWIGMACPAVPKNDDDYYQAMGAVNVLSGGMSARLFTEVREKRALCYSIRASYLSFKDRANILGFASSTNERAQETLDVMLEEFRRLREGIEDEELERVKAGIKSSLIMSQESTSARAGSLAGDWYYLGRVRPLEEIQQAVQNLTSESICEYLQRHPFEDFSIAILGPKPLEIPTCTSAFPG